MSDKEERDNIERYAQEIHRLEQENLKLRQRIEELEGTKKITGGRVPFGYTCPDGVNLVEDPEQQRIIDVMQKMREHHYSYREISRRILDQYGIKISHTGILKILTRNPEPKTKFVF